MNLLRAVVIAVGLIVSGSLHAGPIVGTTANGQLSVNGGSQLYNQSSVVGAGVEFHFIFPSGGTLDLDISDSSIVIQMVTAALSIGVDLVWQVTLDPSLVFASINEVSDTFINGVSVTGFSGNVATFLVLNQSHSPGQTFTAVYSISAQQQVPEPATLALISFGLFGLVLTRRRRAQ